MASTSVPRWRLACDTCDAGAWVGPAGEGFDAWCEACQTPHRLDATPTVGTHCPRCSASLAAWPRFVELWGSLQHLDAVLGAWAGDWEALAAILPERPRFLTDLTPPTIEPDDPTARAVLLEAVARGDYRGALANAGRDSDARAHAACAIAHERLGDTTAAEAAWSEALALGEDARARLARGSLLARAGRFADARTDLEFAGDTFAARWDRAALLVHEAVAASDALPEPGVLARARAGAGDASPYWSDPTVGRLLWSLSVERELARNDPATGPSAAARAALRAAESEFEHATFWDHAMILVGWARLGALDEVARNAVPLARELAATLLDEPALAGALLTAVTVAVADARASMDLDDPVAARHTLAEAFARTDLRRFRIPCAACGRGAIGIEETADGEESGA